MMQYCLYLQCFFRYIIFLCLLFPTISIATSLANTEVDVASHSDNTLTLKNKSNLATQKNTPTIKYILPDNSSVSNQLAPVNNPVTTSYTGKFSEMLLGLAFVVCLIFILSWLMKRVGYNTAASNSQLMKIKSCLPLSTKEKLMLIEVDDEQIIIGVAPGFVGHIKSLSTPINLSGKESQFNFSDTFKNLLIANKAENKKDKISVDE